jgi:hypothetical protein
LGLLAKATISIPPSPSNLPHRFFPGQILLETSNVFITWLSRDKEWDQTEQKADMERQPGYIQQIDTPVELIPGFFAAI